MGAQKNNRGKLVKRREFIKRSGMAGISMVGTGNIIPAFSPRQDQSFNKMVNTHSAKVGRHNGRTCILIDGNPIPGIAILGPVSQRREQLPSSVPDGLAAGIKILFVPVRGDWTAPGKWDFNVAVKNLARTREMAPDAWLFMRIILDAPAWWLEANPSECARNAESNGPEKYASMGSERWISDSSEFLTALVNALHTSLYAEKIIGYHILSGHGGEWIYTGAGEGYTGDYSGPGLRYYRSWLRRKYGDEKWIATAQIPTKAERARSLPALIRDPVYDARVTDYDLCFSDMTADNLLAWCRNIKQATGGAKLVGVFYGYLWQLGLANSLATNGHLSLRRVVESPDVDFVVSFPSYDTREPGSAAQFLLPAESLQAAGKLVFNECDNRTHLTSDQRNAGWQPAIRFQMQRDQRDPANGPHLWSGLWNIWGVESEQIAIDVLRREFAHNLIRGSAYWWFDMGGGWYSSPGILKDFARDSEIAKQAMEWDMSSISQVACIASYSSCAYHSFTTMYTVDPDPSLVDLQADMSTREMYKAGSPIDWWMTEDLVRPEMRQYKALYFHNATMLDNDREKALEGLKNDGRTMIFIGYPGFVSGGKLDPSASSKLTGIKLKLIMERRNAARFQVKDYNLPCTRESTSQIVFGSGVIVSPRLIIDDPDAQVIAHWPDGEPAAAMKKHKDWTAYYFPVPPNNASMFRAIFRNAGCHIYTHNTCRDIVYANKSLLAIHTNHYGQPVKLPGPARVTNLFTGKVVVEKGDTIQLARAWQMVTGTSLFRVEYY